MSGFSSPQAIVAVFPHPQFSYNQL